MTQVPLKRVGCIAVMCIMVTSVLSGQQGLRQSDVDRTKAISTITITLANRQLTPSALTLKPGQYHIIFRNGMFVTPITFDIGVKGSPSRREDGVTVDRAISRGFYTLTPGSYELTIREYPQYKMNLEVRP